VKWLWALALLLISSTASAAPLRVGSKRFTESYILAEIIVATAKSVGIDATHEQGLGGTAVTERALEDGAIDVYPEYTGTIAEAIERDPSKLAGRGLATSKSLGFENTYALAVPAKVGIRKISEIASHPELRIAISHEFVGRTDGWPGLAERYGLSAKPTAIDHALAYEALKQGTIDVTDVYTTDAKIARYGLVVLEDDRHFFPPYDAVLLYRADTLKRFPGFAQVISKLEGSISADEMRKLNARAELDGIGFAAVAAEHFGSTPSAGRASFASGLVDSILRFGPRHLELVAGAVALSTLFGIPLGIIAFARPRLGGVVLGLTGVVQTIPSLALFCFLIPFLGIGPTPALVALFLYGLLPIVRNTHAGLSSIPPELRISARALGLTARERLRYVELPLAAQTILAGIKTSAIVAVGSATIAAFIGAGGFGEPISTGLSLNDVPTILQGAIPAAGLALLVQGAFALIERVAGLAPR
jgi:osmoprotectant transport system permease protein